MKYLAGAYHAAHGDHARAMQLYASGYYGIAKHQRLERMAQDGIESSGNPIPAAAMPKSAGESPAGAHAEVSAVLHRAHPSGAVPGEMR